MSEPGTFPPLERFLRVHGIADYDRLVVALASAYDVIYLTAAVAHYKQVGPQGQPPCYLIGCQFLGRVQINHRTAGTRLVCFARFEPRTILNRNRVHRSRTLASPHSAGYS